MNFIAYFVEERSEMLLHPGGQYKALYYGGPTCLPGMVLAIWYLGKRMPMVSEKRDKAWWETWQWHAVCFIAGLTVGIGLHLWDGSSHFYTRSEMESPTKLYNDFLLFPLYIYMLVSAGVPALLKSKGGWKPRVVLLALLAVFAGLNVYDNNHRPHHGHENFNWSQFEPG
jgi:hypothetical protein